ncbi:MAG: hypothetical protein JJD98_03155 [Polaromonas sp.]|nr:hypothetical protein [Polaromonas sp.]
MLSFMGSSMLRFEEPIAPALIGLWVDPACSPNPFCRSALSAVSQGLTETVIGGLQARHADNGKICVLEPKFQNLSKKGMA